MITRRKFFVPVIGSIAGWFGLSKVVEAKEQDKWKPLDFGIHNRVYKKNENGDWLEIPWEEMKKGDTIIMMGMSNKSNGLLLEKVVILSNPGKDENKTITYYNINDGRILK